MFLLFYSDQLQKVIHFNNLMSVLLHVLLVASFVEKLVQILRIVDLNHHICKLRGNDSKCDETYLQLDEPALTQRRLVDLTRIALQLLQSTNEYMSTSNVIVRVDKSDVPS